MVIFRNYKYILEKSVSFQYLSVLGPFLMAAGGRGETKFKAQFMPFRPDGTLPQCLEGEKYFNQTPDGYRGINHNPAVFTNQGMCDIFIQANSSLHECMSIPSY